MNSYIEKLHVKGVRQFKELNVTFNKGFNFIAGPNGCGKTSILACISHCFEHQNLQYSRFGLDAEFWTDLVSSESLYRVGLGQDSLKSSDYRSPNIKQWNRPEAEGDRKVIGNTEAVRELRGFCPLFIGAHRSIKYKRINGMSRENTLDQQVGSYLTNGAKSLYGEWNPDIKQWLINRYFMIDKDWAHEERKNWEHLENSLPNIGPFESDFRFSRIEKDLEPIFSIYGKECYLEELSSGFQAVLSIIANIIEWIEGSNQAGERLAYEASGTVLIDELDLHLHPEWQFNLRQGLEGVFPNIQFIVTTHSPHVIASAKENEVIVMPKNGFDEIYNLSPSGNLYSGWSTDQILSEIMGVKSLENKVYEKLINEAFLQIENQSISGLKTAIKNIKAVCHPSDTIVNVLTARLATMVMLEA